MLTYLIHVQSIDLTCSCQPLMQGRFLPLATNEKAGDLRRPLILFQAMPAPPEGSAMASAEELGQQPLEQ
ncbi:hypothetical protein [Oryzibacter oryziterrae]|uniref:hypothetical protein n=1 Tax=Oryzibacter oryziterrae TaxID=2766474 RepID=UPI001F19F114|nr:hypothetical protein [Oryzibacter oryziterrae]